MRRATLRRGILGATILLSAGIAAPGGAQTVSAPEGLVEATRSLPEEIEAILPEAAEPREAGSIAPATLVYWNRPIATFRARIGSEDPEERARAAVQRLGVMSERTLRSEVRSRLGTIGESEVALITVGGELAFAYLADDLDPLAQTTFEEASSAVARNLSRALVARREQRSLPLLLRGLAESVAVTLLAVLAIVLVRRLRRWLLRLTTSRSGRFSTVQIFEIDIGDNVRSLFGWLINILLWGVDAILVYGWLAFCLSRFPYTEPWAGALGGWLLRTLEGFALAMVSAAPDLAIILLIVLAARVLVGIVTGVMLQVESGSLEVSWLSPEVAKGARRIAVLLIWLFTVAIVYPFIPGSSSGAFKSISVLVGLMFSLASAGLINHLMAGWVILFSRILTVGDFVRVGDVEGRVTQVGVLSTKLVDPRGEEVVMPNAVVTGTRTINFSCGAAAGGSMASTKITIGYDAPWRQVHAMLCLAAERTSGIRREPQPWVRQVALSDFYVEYELVVEVETSNRPRTLSRLHAAIQDEFNRHGVQIMSPHFLGQPEGAVVVPLERWRRPPAPAADDESDEGPPNDGSESPGPDGDPSVTPPTEPR